MNARLNGSLGFGNTHRWSLGEVGCAMIGWIVGLGIAVLAVVLIVVIVNMQKDKAKP